MSCDDAIRQRIERRMPRFAEGEADSGNKWLPQVVRRLLMAQTGFAGPVRLLIMRLARFREQACAGGRLRV